MADRTDILAALKTPGSIDLSPDSGHIDLSPDVPSESKATSNIWGIDVDIPEPRPSGGGGFLGPIGKIIDIVDTPRAALVSTAKEITDLIQGEGFSATDWWNQTSDNYMVGQFMQDEGWGTGTGWDLAIGLPLDIALDPLTYLTGGAGAAARIGTWRKASDALRKAAVTADKAGDAVKAKRLNDSAVRVAKSRSILAGGDDLAEIGLNPAGMGFTAFGTGRVGRKLFEPLANRASGGQFSKWADARRVKQIPKYLLDDAAFDLSSATKQGLKNQEAVLTTMKNMRAGKSLGNVSSQVKQAAKLASSMAVDVGPRLGKGSAAFGRTIAMGPGRLFNTAIAKTPYLRSLSLALGGDTANLKMASRGYGVDGAKLTDGDVLFHMEAWDNLDIAKNAERAFGISFGQTVSKLRSELKTVNEGLVAKNLPELTEEELLLIGAQHPWAQMDEAQQAATGLLPGSDKARAQELVQEFWETTRNQFNEQIKARGGTQYGSIDEMIDEMYAARYLDLDNPVAQVVGGNRNAWQAPLPESGMMKGSPFQPRTYVANPQKGTRQTNIFLGEELVPPGQHPKGLSIREQMVEIGKRAHGAEFQDMFKKDFWDVVPRYGRDMGRRVRFQRWHNENVSSGLINRATVDKGSVTFNREQAQKLEKFIENAQKHQARRARKLNRSRQDVEKARQNAVKSRPGQEEELVGLQNLLVRMHNEGMEISKIANGLEEALGVTDLSDEARAVIVQLANGTFDAADATGVIAGRVGQEIISVLEPAQQRLSMLRNFQRQLQSALDQIQAMGAPGAAAGASEAQIARFLTKIDGHISNLEEVFTGLNRGLLRGLENGEEVVVMKQVVKLTDDINNPKYPISYTTKRLEGPAPVQREVRRMSPERAESLRDVRTPKQPDQAMKQRREAGRFASGQEPDLRPEFVSGTIETPPLTRHTVQTPTETFHVDRYISPTAGDLGWQITGEGLEAGHPLVGGTKVYASLGEALDEVYSSLGYTKVQDRLPDGTFGGKYFVREVTVPKDSPLWRTQSGKSWSERMEKMGQLSNQLDAEAVIAGKSIEDAEDYIRGLARELDGSDAVIGLQDEIARLRAFNEAQQGSRHWFYELVEQAPVREAGEASVWPPRSRAIWRNADGSERTIYEVGQELGLDDATIAKRYVDQHSRVVKTRGPKKAQSKKTVRAQKKGREKAFEDAGAPQTRLAPREFSDDLTRIAKNLEDDMPWRQFDTERNGFFQSRNRTVPHIVTDVEEKMAYLQKTYNRVQQKINEAADRAGVVKDKINAAEARVAAKEADFEDIRSEIWIERQAQAAEQLQIQAEIQNLKTSGSVDDWLKTADNNDEAMMYVMKNRGLYTAFLDAYGEAQTNFMQSFRNLDKRFVPGGTASSGGNYAVGGLSESAMHTFEEAITAGAKLADYKEVGKFVQQYRTIANWWKAQAVSTPGFILRNLMGGLWINSAIAGVEMGTHSKVIAMAKAAALAGEGNVIDGARLLSQGDGAKLSGVAGLGGMRRASAYDFEVFTELLESGAVGTGQAWSEVATAVSDTATAPFAREINELGRVKSGARMAMADKSTTWNPFSADFKGYVGVRGQNERAEFVLRAALGFDTMKKGGNSIDAVRNINKYHFDYSDLTDVERRIKDVIPFYTWQKNVVPVLLESMGKRPQAWSNLLRTKKELELHSPQEGLVPDYFGENMGIRLPFKIPGIRGGRVYAMPDLPFRNLATFAKEPTSPIRVPLESAFPWIKMPVEIWAKKQSFADIPFSGRYQQVPSWGKIPGLMPILSAMGKAKKSSDGTWVMRDNDIYAVDQFSPVLGRMRRMLPNESAKQRRLAQTWISTIFGGGFRVNDPWEKNSQLIRDNTSFANEWRDILDIDTRRV